MTKMQGVVLPGNSTVEFREYDVPAPGPGQVLLKMKASSICGSDIRAIYHEHLGKGPEGYQGVICGHEPCGQVVELGPDCRRFEVDDRCVVYHISGCGVCDDCRRGYQISCSSELRAAYGWQRDGGMAPYCLVDEKDLVRMPDSMSYVDGALCACGFGTCYEAMSRMNVGGMGSCLVVGLGPMGLAALMLARAMGATATIGVDVTPERIELAAKLGLADLSIVADETALERIREATGGRGCEYTLDCSGNPKGRLLAIQGARQWGKIAFVGEGDTVTFAPSADIIHDQKTIYGSWVTSVPHLEELVELIDRWGIHPEETLTHRFTLDQAARAFETMAEGKCGKVTVVFDE